MSFRISVNKSINQISIGLSVEFFRVVGNKCGLRQFLVMKAINLHGDLV